LRYVSDFVCLCIPVEVGILLVRLHVQHCNIGVEQQRSAIERGTAAALHLRGAEVPVLERGVFRNLPLHLANACNLPDGGWRVHVVGQRRSAAEPFVPHELLGIEAAIRFAKGNVPLARYAAECVIDGHGGAVVRFREKRQYSVPCARFRVLPLSHRLPRSSCSLSIASNSARKLPLPKLLAPLRWMIS